MFKGILLINWLIFSDLFKADGLSCWGGSYVHDFELEMGQSTPCWYTADTCKRVTTYSAGFRNFPDTKASCVSKATDGPYGCSDCTNSSCTFIVYNSLTDVVLNTKCDAISNQPQVQSCFNGTLTTSSQKIAPCVPPTIYCQLDLTNRSAPIGKCTNTFTSNQNISLCSEDNCNGLLTCIVGTNINSSTKASLCSPADKFCVNFKGIDGKINGTCSQTYVTTSLPGVTTSFCSKPTCNAIHPLQLSSSALRDTSAFILSWICLVFITYCF